MCINKMFSIRHSWVQVIGCRRGTRGTKRSVSNAYVALLLRAIEHTELFPAPRGKSFGLLTA